MYPVIPTKNKNTRVYVTFHFGTRTVP